jgi:hypothetical protein
MILDIPAKQICVNNPLVVLDRTQCRGCPAFCAAFDRMVLLIEEAQEKMVFKNLFSLIKSVNDIYRNELLENKVTK